MSAGLPLPPCSISSLCSVHCKSTLKIDSTKRRVGFSFYQYYKEIIINLSTATNHARSLVTFSQMDWKNILPKLVDCNFLLCHQIWNFSSLNTGLFKLQLNQPDSLQVRTSFSFPFLPSPSAIFFGQNVNGAVKVSKTISESLMMKESRCCFSQKESKELAVILQAPMKTLGDR